MRIMMVLKWTGLAQKQYEEIISTMQWKKNIPKGLVLHSAGFHDNCLRVTDVWESAADFDTFAKSRLMPTISQLGIKGEPQIDMFPLHNLTITAQKN